MTITHDVMDQSQLIYSGKGDGPSRRGVCTPQLKNQHSPSLPHGSVPTCSPVSPPPQDITYRQIWHPDQVDFVKHC